MAGDGEPVNSPSSVPPRGRLIDYNHIDVISPMIQPPQPRLVVSGQKPSGATEIALVPLMYVSQPSYWGIQVVASFSREDEVQTLPAESGPGQYTVELDIVDVTGKNGVEVIGATRTERLDLAS